MNQTTRKLMRLLDALIEMAEDESLTGALSAGQLVAVRRYNAIVQELRFHEDLPEGLFDTLPESASFADVGVEGRLLRSYLLEDDAPRGREGRAEGIEYLVALAPFASREDLAALVRDHAERGGAVNPELIVALAPFLDRDEIGKLLRSHVQRPPEPPEPPAPPTTGDERGPNAEAWGEPVLDEPAAFEPPPRSLPNPGGSTEIDAILQELDRRDILPDRRAFLIARLKSLFAR